MIGNLGLANRARKLVLGTEQTIKAIRKKRVYLVLLASDASDNTKKKMMDKTKFYQTPIIEKFTSVEQSSQLGKGNIMVIGVLDEGFGHLLMKHEGSDNNGSEKGKDGR